MNRFKTMNAIGGWAVFVVALITYMLTLEPTTSLWDCGEFIATSYKMEVGHPPGTPFFFLINRLGAMFAGDPSNVAYAINTLSALESALTIAFLFWTISHLARRIYRKDEQSLTSEQSWAVLGAAAIGSLAYTFTDTFWFSAVEAEVYALSSLFTAVVFWAILKWEEVADRPGSNRWLVIIAYLMGLSIGAHILNLLAIPALVFIFYFKKFPGRKKVDMWKPGVASVLILGAFYLLTPTVVSVGAFVDRIFVNSLSLPINSGLVAVVLVLLGGLGYGIYRSHKAQRATLNTIFLSAVMVVIGFSTYGVVLIRASANPPMNSNNPSDPYTLVSFLNREQYGSRPLVTGQTYASPTIGTKFKDTYMVKDGKYVPIKTVVDYEYDPATEVLFPRMYSSKGGHMADYRNWGEVEGRKVKTMEGGTVTIPTFGENIRFFLTYQLNYMYWRYFLWNFVGRQSDIQGNGITEGNWLSGITPIDELYLGSQDNLPSEMANNKGRNTYFFLPFILGLLGMFFHLRRDGRNFAVVMLLFFMTGLAIILYLNQTPGQPRERDYSYAASFYAFAVWIGIGLIPIFERLAKWLKNGKVAAAVSFVVCLSVPVVLATQNWDDHDRSGRTMARDVGMAYLNSTLPNSILINYGDNDTFPVWYAQEVEGVRPDVRVMNGSYISGDWYIDQMRVRANESDPVPFTLPRHKYTPDAMRVFPIKETPRPGGGEWTAKEVMSIINSDDKHTKVFDNAGNGYDFVPTRRIAIPVDKAKAVASGIVREQDLHLVDDTVYLEINKNQNSIDVMDVLMIDLYANFNWERPLYFTSPMGKGTSSFGLTKFSNNEAWSYFQQDGAAYRFVPIKSEIDRNFGVGRIDVEYLYDNLMNKFKYGNISNPDVYVDSFTEGVVASNQYRVSFGRLADKLLEQGDTVRAVKVLDKAMAELPLNQLHYDEMLIPIIEGYWRAGEDKKGDELAMKYIDVMAEYLAYFDQLKGSKRSGFQNLQQEKERNLYLLYAAGEAYGKRHVLEAMVGMEKAK